MTRDPAALERELAALRKINRVLMERVENAVNSSGSDYAIFEQNILLQRRVEEHTGELEDRHRRLEALLEEQKRIGRELRESGDRLATVMDSVEAFIYIADMQTYELLFVNAYGKRSWRGQNLHGQPCWKVLQGLDGPCPFCTNDRLLTPEGEPAGVLQWEFRNHVNGRWYDLRDRAIRWTDGRLVRMEIATDITERKQNEKALQKAKEEAEENEARFRALHNASFGGIAIHDQGVILDCNQGLSKMSGYTQDELIGMDGLQLIAESSRAWVRENIARGNEKPYEAVGRRKNGEEFPMRLEARTIPYRGQQVRSVEFRDITEEKQAAAALRESEEKFSTLFASMTETVVLYDLVNDARGQPVDYRVVDCNRAFLQQTNVAREAALGRLASDVFRVPVPPGLEEYSRVVQTGEPCRFESHLARPDVYLATSVVPMGRNRFATISSDVTAVRKAQRMLAAKNKELERIVYVASHDLRSPLVNVDGYGRELEFALTEIIEILECGEPVSARLEPKLRELLPDMMESLRHIRGSSKQMDGLLKGLLKLSRSGRAALTIGPLDMPAVLGQVASSFQYQFREAGAELRLGELPPCLGDAMQAGQVFSNLIGNALKYRAPERPCVVSVSGFIDGDAAVYVVEDNGRGVPPEHQEKIFDLFHRIDPAGTEGEGLGLTIVRQILGRLGGEIRVESAPGEGSRFIVTLPAEGSRP